MRRSIAHPAFIVCLAALFIISVKSHRKCLVTLNSDAYGNSWETPNVKWKSPKKKVSGEVEATVRGRINIPTNVGADVKSHVCYATLRVNLTDCSIILGTNATAENGWSLHKSPVYNSEETWLYNGTVAFRPDCPEAIHVEVFEP